MTKGIGSGNWIRPRPACGTYSGYHWHRRNGQKPCEACKTAMREYSAAKRGYKSTGPRVQLTDTERRERANAKARERRRKQKAIIDQWKLSKGNCADCGWEITPERLVAIDCDHIDPKAKKFNLSEQAGSIPNEELLLELDKCEARCRNCHAMRTRDEGHWYHRNDNQGSTQNGEMEEGQAAGTGWQPALPLVPPSTSD